MFKSMQIKQKKKTANYLMYTLNIIKHNFEETNYINCLKKTLDDISFRNYKIPRNIFFHTMQIKDEKDITIT